MPHPVRLWLGLCLASGWLCAQPPARVRASVILPRDRYIWPHGVIPYVIDAEMPNRQAALDAMQHWSDRTPVRFVERQTEANFVHFRAAGNLCLSRVGMVEGEQFIDLPPAVCSLGDTIHEIGHTVGLFHEQSRADRDRWVRFYPENIVKSLIPQYTEQIAGGDDAGLFDYGAIMMYPRWAGARAPQLATLESLPAGLYFGQRDGLSPQEIETVRRWYAPPSGRTVRYVFGRWNDDGVAAHTITVTADTPVYTAAFARQYRLAAAVSPPEGGAIAIAPAAADGYYTEGAAVTVTVTPDAGWYFTGWSGAPLPAFEGGIHGWGENPVSFRVTYPDMRYLALLDKNQPQLLVTDPPHLRLLVDGYTYTTPVAVPWAPGSTHTVEAPETATPVSGTRYVFRAWSDSGTRAHTVTASAGAPTFTASYGTQFQVAAAVTPDQGGGVTVAPASPDGYYDAGATVELTATPAPGYRLVNWSGDLTGTARTIALTSDVLATANFARAGELSYYGVVHGASLQPGAVSAGQEVVIFGAEAAARVAFDGLEVPVAAGPDRLTVTAPAALAGRRSSSLQVGTSLVLLDVAEATPAIYTADGSGCGAARAAVAARGDVVSLAATGLGSADVSRMAAEIDSQPAEVVFAGGGRVDVRIPAAARTGPLPVRLIVDFHPSPPGVTLEVR